MTNDRNRAARRLSAALSDAVYDIPSWLRAVVIVAGLAGAVVVIVGSLNGGQDHTVGVDKLLHFGGYATLAAIFVIGLRPNLYIPALVLLTAMSWGIEFLQPFNERSFDVGDGMANMAGLSVGAVFGLMVRLLIRVVRTRAKQARLSKHRRKYGPGSVILRQGAVLQQFYVIERGEVRLSREVDGRTAVLGTMGPGDAFALMGVIQSQPQYATVEAVTDTTLYGVDLNDLIEASGGPSEPVAAVLAVMARHLRELADRVVENRSP